MQTKFEQMNTKKMFYCLKFVNKKKMAPHGDNLIKAINAVKMNNLSIRKASSIYNIDKSTLSRRLNGKNESKRGRKLIYFILFLSYFPKLK